MKQLVCEMCGSKDLVKQDGMFVCQACGTKYSVEEAKKMMIEGTVDVQGTVKVDNSGLIEKYLQNARRAKETNNNENAAKYYELVLLEDPSNWEANFYSIYCKALTCTIAQIESSVNSISNCLDGVFSLIRDNLEGEQKELACIEVAEEVFSAKKMFWEAISATFTKHETLNGSANDAFSRSTACVNLLVILGNRLDVLASEFEADNAFLTLSDNTDKTTKIDRIQQYAIDAWKKAEALCFTTWREIMSRKYYGMETSFRNLCEPISQQIRKYEPDHTNPFDNQELMRITEKNISARNGGCYVATCVYGSYDCPQVWTLRRYRDNMLAATWYGRAFIKAYYAVSPTLVEWFGHTKWFKRMWKGKLDSMVAKLNAEGVEDTPYQDKTW